MTTQERQVITQDALDYTRRVTRHTALLWVVSWSTLGEQLWGERDCVQECARECARECTRVCERVCERVYERVSERISAALKESVCRMNNRWLEA